jgi:hypothetical protein
MQPRSPWLGSERKDHRAGRLWPATPWGGTLAQPLDDAIERPMLELLIR